MRKISITKTNYYCELCGNCYEKESSAKEHETSHCSKIISVTIPKDPSYGLSEKKTIYPLVLNVRYETGEEVEYRMRDPMSVFYNNKFRIPEEAVSE